MDKRDLIGSPARDAFKHWHKTYGPKNAYGCDVDFLFVEKFPPGIAAGIDYKQPGDTIGFSEIIAYNAFLDAGIPMFIVESHWVKDGDRNFEQFSIFQYVGGDFRPNPPIPYFKTIKTKCSATDYWDWEMGVRRQYRITSNHGNKGTGS